MNAAEEVDLQNLWMALQKKKNWRVLAVVPAMRQIASLDAASAIAEVSWQFRGEPTVVLDLREINLRLVEYHKKQIEEHVKNGEHVILALASIQQNPTTISLAQIADTAVLVVRLGETSMKSAVRTVEEIGHDKFAGTILAKKKARSHVVQQAPAPASVRQTVKMPAGGGAKT